MGSPTTDSAGALYIVTGNAKRCSQAGQMFYSIVKLNASDLSLVQSWQLPSADRFTDNGFGATPALFIATIGGVNHNMVGVLNKNGKYYAFDRTNISQGPIREAQVGNSGSAHNIASSAWDGTNLYVAGQTTTINGTSCTGSVNALNPADGKFIWRKNMPDYRQGFLPCSSITRIAYDRARPLPQGIQGFFWSNPVQLPGNVHGLFVPGANYL